MDEGMIAAEAYMDKRTDVVLAEKNDLIESQAKRIEELEKTNTELKSRFAHLNFMLSELQRRKEPELARNCPVCGKPQHGAVLHGPNTPVYWHVDGTGDNCEGLPTENAELKEKIATLRAKVEEREGELAAMLLAGGQYIAAHKLMRVRFQNAEHAEIYTRAAKRFEELIDG